jgi:hypothetical protein
MAETTNQNQSNPDAEEVDQSSGASNATKTNKVHKARKTDKAGQRDVAPQMENLLEGFTPEEIASLVKVKQEVETGHYSDITNEHRKLLFVKWLVEHDKIGS